MSCASETSGSDMAAARTRSRRSSPRERGSTCTTTSLAGSTAWIASSTLSAAACPPDGGAGGEGHHDVGEVAAAGLPQPQPPQLDVGLERLHRLARARAGVLGRAVHEHAPLRLEDERPGDRAEDEQPHHQGGERVRRGRSPARRARGR